MRVVYVLLVCLCMPLGVKTTTETNREDDGFLNFLQSYFSQAMREKRAVSSSETTKIGVLENIDGTNSKIKPNDETQIVTELLAMSCSYCQQKKDCVCMAKYCQKGCDVSP
ncbi:uncharacterized protein LOC128218786 [Mya arenaria]|uniref:uncharacterized protein LOC128218786 n=1 Tax=Mya arenaria TaxID=6604 RepID=UPI0022E10BD1|nr:uncharacterized protein LOC128218786 [Mya arenaria]